jgi:hypothetical protein
MKIEDIYLYFPFLDCTNYVDFYAVQGMCTECSRPTLNVQWNYGWRTAPGQWTLVPGMGSEFCLFPDPQHY